MTTQVIDRPEPSGEAEAVIHNPANKSHFMVVAPVRSRLRVLIGNTILAETSGAFKVSEVGKSAYPARYYFPPDALRVPLSRADKPATHCPLKGDATYFEHDGEEIAWAYDTLDFADILAGHYSFWDERVEIVTVE